MFAGGPRGCHHARVDFALDDDLEALAAEARAVAETWSSPVPEDSWLIGHSREFSLELARRGWLGMTWPVEEGGGGRSPLERLEVFEALIAGGAPVAYSWFADRQIGPTLLRFGTPEQRARFLPGIIAGTDQWCVGMSEPDAGSDVASLRTRAERDGDEYVITGHKVWTSYSDVADWCLVLARTDTEVPKHKGLSAFVVPMDQPGIEQRPLRMINGITREFGEVSFDGARVPAADMIGAPGGGWRLAMTVVSHEREPGELGYVARYRKVVSQLTEQVRAEPERFGNEAVRDLGWAIVEAEMLRLHVCRRLSDSLDGISHGPEGSVDKLLMTYVEQAVGHAALAVGGTAPDGGDDTWLKVYLYSRAQSVMGGTSQIQRNLIAGRILELPSS